MSKAELASGLAPITAGRFGLWLLGNRNRTRHSQSPRPVANVERNARYRVCYRNSVAWADTERDEERLRTRKSAEIQDDSTRRDTGQDGRSRISSASRFGKCKVVGSLAMAAAPQLHDAAVLYRAH
jgi:hypothetical protein